MAATAPLEIFHPMLSCVDDFLSCLFRDIDLVRRVKRLLQSQRKAGVSAGARSNAGTHHKICLERPDCLARSRITSPELSRVRGPPYVLDMDKT